MQDEQLSIFSNVAAQALANYGLDDAPRQFLQHSENVTFRVSKTEDIAYLLRIHVPVVSQFGDHGADTEMVNSELRWQEALRRTTDIPVPKPIFNWDGKLVTVVEHEGKRYNCSVLEWLPGEIYGVELETESTVAQIGSLVGRLHFQSSRWRRPRGFVRPERDMAYFNATLQMLRPAVDDGRISYHDFKQFELALDSLSKMMAVLHKTRQNYGLLHGDLHRGNFLIHDGRISLIDFSLCALGFYLFDLAICLSSVQPQFHSLFLLNYQQYFRLPPDAERLIEGFFIASAVGTFSFWINNPEAQEILVNRVPRIANEYATRFVRDERFWFAEPSL